MGWVRLVGWDRLGMGRTCGWGYVNVRVLLSNCLNLNKKTFNWV